MKHLESNIDIKTNKQNNYTQTINNNINIVESQLLSNKYVENINNITNTKTNLDGKYNKEDDDLIEQDLSDVEDNYEEPSVQRYLPGIFVDVKLKTKNIERYGDNIAIPMIVDFYSECLKKYGEEKNFIYEESYLEHMRIKEDELWPELNKVPKNTTDVNSDSQTQTTLDNKQILNVSEQQKNTIIEENLDDVIWLKNRPNDPLLRCIRSITDRLNIQGIVGDPTSYLKKGGDDMHYDMDDPFFDDSAMLSELKMSKSDILLNRAMEREFSDWSEEEQDLDYTYVEPEDFVADYYSNFEKELRLQDAMEAEPKLLFDPSGWRVYLSKIPRQFLYIYYDFENSSKKITEPITDKMLRLKIKELLESIFKKLLKTQDFGKMSMRSKSKTKTNKIKTEENKENETKLDVDIKEEDKDRGENNQESKEKEEQGYEEMKEKEETSKANKTKVVHKDVSSENFKKRGLNCILQYRIVDLNGKILRWIVKSITSMTNCCSEYEIHSEWFFIVIAYNEKLISEQSNKIKTKLTAKLQSMKPKRAESMISLVSESCKALSKSVGILRKLLREHRDLTYNKSSKTSSKVIQETNKKKSLIELSLDSASDEHCEYMGGNQNAMELPTEVKEEKIEEQLQTPRPYKENKKYTEKNKNKNKENKEENEENEQEEMKEKEEKEQQPSTYNSLDLDKDYRNISSLVDTMTTNKTLDYQGLSTTDKNETQEGSTQYANLTNEVLDDDSTSSSNDDNSDLINTQYLELLEMNSSSSGQEYGPETISTLDQSQFFLEVPQENNEQEGSNKNKEKENEIEKGNSMELEEENNNTPSDKDNKENKEDELGDNEEKDEEKREDGEENENNKENYEQESKEKEEMKMIMGSPKKSPMKEDDLESILKQTKIMKRIKDISSLFRLVGSDVLSLVQMNNLAVSVANKINNKEFKHVVEQLGLTHNPFDQTYRRVGEITTKLIQELYNIKVNISTDVMKVVVINLQSHLKVEELYEKKNKKPLLLFSNSKIKASPGRVILNIPKDKTRKKTVQIESPKSVNETAVESPRTPKDTKSPPRKKSNTPLTQPRVSPTRIKDEETKEKEEPTPKKKKTSRVSSLKDLLLSRFSN